MISMVCMDNMTFDFILRILVAALLGGAVGLEREYRDKAAKRKAEITADNIEFIRYAVKF